jgi:hypothetical protein
MVKVKINHRHPGRRRLRQNCRYRHGNVIEKTKTHRPISHGMMPRRSHQTKSSARLPSINAQRSLQRRSRRQQRGRHTTLRISGVPVKVPPISFRHLQTTNHIPCMTSQKFSLAGRTRHHSWNSPKLRTTKQFQNRRHTRRTFRMPPRSLVIQKNGRANQN